MIALLLGLGSLAAWLYLLLGRGFFWLEKVAPPPPLPAEHPLVAVVVPARNEAELIARNIEALLNQDYAGNYHIVLVDDHSSDGTSDLARRAAGNIGRPERLTLLQAPPIPPQWSGKLWALNTGIQHTDTLSPEPEFILLTDADILHPAHSLSQLVARAGGKQTESGPFELVSMMARLHCRSFAEKLMIPAFVFFFQMLYPFRWARDPNHASAAAAGGVMLLRRRTLAQVGGLAAIRSALIDDCTLAGVVKRRGRIWIGLSSDTVSMRCYERLANIWRMVARTAFTQLRHSALLLAGTVLGLCITYICPPLLLPGGSPWAAGLGAASWILMTLAYLPTVRLYRLNPLWSLVLPLAALLYAGATVDSARRYWLGKGGEWKGRSQA